MTRLRLLLRLLLAAAALAAAGRGFAGDVYVVSNMAVALTPEEVKEIFLGEVQFNGALRLQPVDNAGAQADFLTGVLKMTGAKYSAVWTKKAFRDGLNAPVLKGSDAEVLNHVRSNRGAIGYVSSVPQGVHVVGKF